MLKLGRKREPFWLDLPHGVRLRVRALTSAVYQTAWQKALAHVRELVEHQLAIREAGGRVEDLPDLEDDEAQHGLAQVYLCKGLAEAAIIEWENVIGPDDQPAPVTRENIWDAFDDHLIADTFLERYVKQHYERLAEGNASAPSPNGISAGAPDTARGAGNKKSRARTASRAATASAVPTGATSH